MLLVYVDTEEEFDWARPFSSAATSVTNIAAQGPAIEIFSKYGVRPTLLVDYPVVDQEAGVAPIRSLLKANLIGIGAQLHPWVTPPFTEQVNNFNSYPGNLPEHLERTKLISLTEQIEKSLGVRPAVYRAGRYGLGQHTIKTLVELGYKIDCSVYPDRDFSAQEGPSFFGVPVDPYWIDHPAGVLEIPLTSGYLGLLRNAGPFLARLISNPWARTFRLTSALRRAGLLEHSWLSPEGVSLSEAKELTRWLHAGGCRVFSVTYHSPSLVPGFTPYVRTAEDLERFLHWLGGYAEFFFNEMNGVAATPHDIYEAVIASATINEVR